jgi:CheY-like chemotaxis protein
MRASAHGSPPIVSIAVSDTGMGIAPEKHAAVFEPFEQVDSSSTRSAGGTGLGLAIVRKMSALLGGTVTMQSEVNKGSTFTVSLPASLPSKDPTDAAPDVPAPSSPVAASARTIVVIDDNVDDASILREALSDAGFTVHVATSAAAGIELVRHHRPLAVTIDIRMPVRNGWQLIRELKSSPELCRIPLIVASIEDQKRLAFELGVAAYLTKPFSTQDLHRVLDQVAVSLHEIVIVDDDEDALRLLREAFAEQTMTCRAFSSARAVLEHFRQRKRADVILVDLQMPEMDGFELIARLRSEPATAAIPIVVVTARDLTSADVERLGAGVAGLIRKGEPSLLAKELGQLVNELVTRPRANGGA